MKQTCSIIPQLKSCKYWNIKFRIVNVSLLTVMVISGNVTMFLIFNIGFIYLYKYDNVVIK